MKHVLKNHIENQLHVKISKVRPISGGDISQAFLLETESERFFCKVNEGVQAYKMFASEKSGLEAISETKAISSPKVLLCEKLEVGGFLLMEYIEPKRTSSNDMELFGHQLAALHKNSGSEEFGWAIDNFIGSLPQSNQAHSNWTNFYVQERLVPQLKLARGFQRLNRNEIPSVENLLETCQNLFPETRPALLHGDLWSGNYLMSKGGIPYLIDPATYFGHREIDIAMTKLFGGFDIPFYGAYSEHFPEIGGEKERTDIYQLYYLLVHLNLFGRSYYGQVKKILEKYF